MKKFRISRTYMIEAESELEAKKWLDDPAEHIHYVTFQDLSEIKQLPKSGNIWIADAKSQILGK
jgi:hypothetical protein